MNALDELKPTQKLLVMDLLDQAGVDVSDWKNFKGDVPANNPKYCYNWSFEKPGQLIVVCLWLVIFRRRATPCCITIISVCGMEELVARALAIGSEGRKHSMSTFRPHTALGYRKAAQTG
jgi:hypothetical protein